jgi:hypothetical protein
MWHSVLPFQNPWVWKQWDDNTCSQRLHCYCNK